MALKRTQKRRVCFVTGTRAEFGLMRSTLQAIRAHRRLELQIVATGMHLDRKHGAPLSVIREAGLNVDRVAKWTGMSGADPPKTAAATGLLVSELAGAFDRLESDVILVVGDRVEAFAAATAGHISQLPVAHVHGGDRAMGQVDDSLRHAITKMSHIHFPATRMSAGRIEKLGEEKWRIFPVGSPGVDGITESAARWERLSMKFPDLNPGRFVLLVLHPADADADVECARAGAVLTGVLGSKFERVVVIHPNNDPGSRGIVSCWNRAKGAKRVVQRKNVERGLFLGLMREAGCLVGNSSSGIIEAASFGTPVLNIGPRQEGRQHSGNVTHCDYQTDIICKALNRLWNGGQPQKSRAKNVYGESGAGKRIASVLGAIELSPRLVRKVIRY